MDISSSAKTEEEWKNEGGGTAPEGRVEGAKRAAARKHNLLLNIGVVGVRNRKKEEGKALKTKPKRHKEEAQRRRRAHSEEAEKIMKGARLVILIRNKFGTFLINCTPRIKHVLFI